MLATLPSCRMLAPVVPVCVEVVKDKVELDWGELPRLKGREDVVNIAVVK